MNYYKLRIEFKKDNGYEEVGIYRTKTEMLNARLKFREIKPYAMEVFRGKEIIFQRVLNP